MSAIYTMGIDIGSTASKSVILKDGKEIFENEHSMFPPEF